MLDLGGVRLLTDPVLTDRVAHLRRHSAVSDDVAGAVDGVLISHVHLDHLHLPSLRRLPRTTPLIVPAGAGDLVARSGFSDVRETRVGQTVTISGVDIATVRAVHKDRRGPHSRVRAAAVGYVVRWSGMAVYFAGDTDLFAEMSDLAPVDVALLPIWGWGSTLGEGHLDPGRAAEAVRILDARTGRADPLGHVQPGGPRPPAAGVVQRADRAVPRRARQRRAARGRCPGPRSGSDQAVVPSLAAHRIVTMHAFPGHAGRRWPLARGARSLASLEGAPMTVIAFPATQAVVGRSLAALARSHRIEGAPMNDDLRLAAPALRPPAERPSLGVIVGRVVIVTVAGALTLWLLAGLLDDFSIDEWWQALLAGFVVGLVSAVVWPALAFVVVPLSVLTLGIGAIVLDALVVALVLDLLPGVTLTGFWTAIVIVVALAAVTTLVSSVLALDDDAWFEASMGRRARRRSGAAADTDVPGVVFVQIDGLSRPVLERALRSGDVPTLHRWLRDGSHRLDGWETGWSSQTGVSQCGILHGSVVDMPAFRWVDKATGTVVVSNHPASAAAIERDHSDGEGLLAHNGSSYGNLFSGDAERAIMTMSVIAKRKEGRVGAGYFGYFSRPQRATRTFIGLVADVFRERVAAWRQVRHGVEPRVARGWSYAVLRAYTTVVSRDVNVVGVLNDMCEGRAAIYIDMLGYDEVSHHSGPERADALGGAARHRPPGRAHRAGRALRPAAVPGDRAVRSRPDAGRAVLRACRRDARRSRRPPVRVGGVGRLRRRGRTDGVERMAPAGQPSCGSGGGHGPSRHHPDRARLGQPRVDLPARPEASPDPGGDRRGVSGADQRADVASGDRLRPRPHGCRRLDRPRPRRQPRPRVGRGAWRRSARSRSGREPSTRSARPTATRPSPT